jgi:hypothetical protein
LDIVQLPSLPVAPGRTSAWKGTCVMYIGGGVLLLIIIIILLIILL